MPDYKHFEVQETDGVHFVHLVDPKLFDALIVTELQEELLQLIDDAQPHKLLVNFGRVAHCSTAVINGLLRAKKRLVSKGGVLKLCGMRENVREAYRLLNLDGTVFEIYDSCAIAKDAFQ